MTRLRRRSTGVGESDASSMRVECDSTALALVPGDGSDDADMERAARANEAEEIDTEDDDAEFEERAHWGRRRAGAKKNGSRTKKRIHEHDKSQPKINLFCVVHSSTTDKLDHSESPSSLPDTTLPAIQQVTKVQVKVEEEDGNGGSSVVEAVVSTTKTMATPVDRASPSRPTNRTNLPQGEMTSPLLSPTMLFGRPKRKVVLQAEHAQLQAATDLLFMTPPVVQPKKKESVNKATLDGEPERKATVNGNGSTVLSSGRKRKLDLIGEKKSGQHTPSTSQKATAKMRPSTFFMTEEQKKQLIEIEAIESFKEQLRDQREKDLAFFGNRDAHNPFFKARVSHTSSQKIVDVDTAEVIEVFDSPESSPATQRKTRWSKEMEMFPPVQHILHQGLSKPDNEQSTIKAPLLRLVKKTGQATDDVIDVEDNEDEEMELCPTVRQLTPDEADAQVPYADTFWLLTASSNFDENDLVVASLSGQLSTEELVEKLSESCGIKENRVRNTLAALECARIKRQDKALNLSLVDKYLPVQTAGMIGNKAPLKRLSAWLSAWKNGGINDSDRNYDDSLFAFEGDDSEDEDDGTQLYRLFVLEGDVGSGKSAAVYACAEELGYEIIEINAGQVRTGKAVVDIAGEATQSTRVLHGGGPVNDKKSNNKKVKSKKRRTDRDRAKPSHLSLVLFEDVDLVFEEDKGFLSTLGSIAKHSKCPIVVTCRHLPGNFPSSPPSISEKLMRPSTREFVVWLSLVAHLEDIALSQLLMSRLAEFFACDIRRTLQFLQTYRHRINDNLHNDASLKWTPNHLLPTLTSGSDANAAITITDSQDEEPLPRSVPAWSRSPLRLFDLMDSNFLPLLSGSVCERDQVNGTKDTRERTEKLRHVECLDDVWSVLDSVSMADEWESRVSEVHRVNANQEHEGADFFHADAVTLATLDMRMLSLSKFVANRKPSANMLSLQECTLTDGVERALQVARDDRERAKKATRLAALKTKLEISSIAKGSERVGGRFCMDYVPLIARIADKSEPFQESRRRASRRNHYLGDVLLDMSALDDIRDIQAWFPPIGDGEDDEIVPQSASSTIDTISI